MNGGDGGDSDEEGDECLIHFEGDEDYEIEEDSVDLEINDCGGKSKGMSCVDLIDSSGGIIGNEIVDESDNCRMELDTSDERDVKTCKPPSDQKKPDTQLERDEPIFEDVDNPGNWPQHCYSTRFNGGDNSKKLSATTIAS